MRFIDTSAFYALADPGDSRHADAVALLRMDEHRSLLTTDRVLEETWTLLGRRKGHGVAVRVLRGLRASRRLRRLDVDLDLAAQAWAWLERHDERRYSFVDASSFAAMRREGVHEACAFDGDFTAAGFVELRP